MNDVTEDRIFGGRVRLTQPRTGYRANADTLLLAAAVTEAPRLLEAGCGAGGALLAVAVRFPAARLTGVERDPAFAALARDNIAANSANADIIEADILNRAGFEGVFDGAFCNPPYLDPARSRAPTAERQGAHLAEAPLSAWIAALADRLTGGAALTMIHRADALPELLAAFMGRLGGVQALPIHPRIGEPAHRVLVRAVKGARAPFQLRPALILHEGAAFTPAADAIFRGDAAIGWD